MAAATESNPVQKPAPAPVPIQQRVASRVALAAGVFCLVLAAALAVGHFRHKSLTWPLEHPQVVKLKEALVKDPLNDALKRELRALDLEYRRAHDRYLARVRRGQWLLLGGGVVGLAALQALVWRRKIARPGRQKKPPGWEARELMQSSAAVAVLGAALGAGAWWLVAGSGSRLDAGLLKPAAPEHVAGGAEASTTPYPTAAEMARNWPRFRGPAGGGLAAVTNVPLQFDLKTGEGVLWKVASPTRDPGSPVVWEKRLFVSGGNAQKREVFCYDTESGNLLWRSAADNVPGSSTIELSEMSGGWAASTVATDGRRVYAIFANGDVAAFDYAGKKVWARGLGPLKNPYGHATSLELWQDRLIVQLDHGEAEDKLAKLMALNTADGSAVWEKARDSHPTWSTPVAVETGGKAQVIALGNPFTIGYTAADGAELWRFKGLEGEVTPSPIVAGGWLLAVNPSSALLAIKLDGAGDITTTHLVWKAEDGIPDITSPVSDGERVYLAGSGGMITCYGLKDGKKLWEKDLELQVQASPSVAGGRLYVFTSQGPMVVLAAAAEPKELARSETGDEVLASPAFAEGRIYVRGKTNLFCIGTK